VFWQQTLDSWDLNEPVKKSLNGKNYLRFDSTSEQKVDLFLRKGQIKDFYPGNEDLTYVDVQEPKITRIKGEPSVSIFVRSDNIVDTLEAKKNGFFDFLSEVGGLYTSFSTIFSLICFYFGKSLYRFYLIDTLFWRAKSRSNDSIQPAI
jgi:hypothetical protein